MLQNGCVITAMTPLKIFVKQSQRKLAEAGLAAVLRHADKEAEKSTDLVPNVVNNFEEFAQTREKKIYVASYPQKPQVGGRMKM